YERPTQISFVGQSVFERTRDGRCENIVLATECEMVAFDQAIFAVHPSSESLPEGNGLFDVRTPPKGSACEIYFRPGLHRFFAPANRDIIVHGGGAGIFAGGARMQFYSGACGWTVSEGAYGQKGTVVPSNVTMAYGGPGTGQLRNEFDGPLIATVSASSTQHGAFSREGDTSARVILESIADGGGIAFGDGRNAADVRAYRLAAGVLATDGQIHATQGLRLGSIDASGPAILNGSGSPEGSVVANLGSLYHNQKSGAWFRKTTQTGNTGWVTPPW
ncbi:hypothetical protein, partial [Sphingorhabdus sp.]|uniref:hypothetical protein n=1 Tax=Sphingorhabdus sp. TaxID=1902408 RepID=UPI003593D09B